MSRSSVIELLDLLGVSDDEALKAILSVFASVQPGPIAGAWKKRSNYGVSPTTKEIWSLFVEADFRCIKCGSHSNLGLDHVNRDTSDISPENLRVVCHSCNRASNSRPVQNTNAGLRIYKAMMELYHRHGVFPKPRDIQKAAGVSQLSGARYMIHFFATKLRAPIPRELEDLESTSGI